MVQMDKIKKILELKTSGESTKQKTSEASQRVILNRILNSKVPIDNKTAIEILKSVSKKSGVDMSFLAANAIQEGMNKVFYNERLKNFGEVPKDEYPINGFTYYGLDTFGDAARRLKEKGYIPDDFNYRTFGTKNEKGQEVTAAEFKNNEDALLAKAAYLKDFRDSVVDYSKRKNLKLDRETEKYLTMSAYNGGIGNAMKMIDELATGKYNQKDYVKKGLTSRQGVHKNISPRINNMMLIEQLTSGPVAPYNRPSYDIFKLFNK